MPFLYRALLSTCVLAGPVLAGPHFLITFPTARSPQPLDGRLLLLLSTDGSQEPRMQIGNSLKTQMIFGQNVDSWKPGEATEITGSSAFGFPVESLDNVKPGEYYVQAVLHRYETFHRSDGHTVKLPMDRGEGQHWNIAPGNLYSKPAKIALGNSTGQVKVELTEEIGPITPPKDTKYVRHVRIQSKVLTDFWGKPIYLGAHVLVPEGFDQHPEAHYPLAVNHGHFPEDLDGFRTEPPDPNLKPDYSDRFHLAGYNRVQQEEAYKFYKQWTAPNFPRFLVIEIQHANQFYDDSYAVDSANVGPYGQAIETELIPYIETKFRGIGQGWARFTYGGSTGGWEALAVQVFYPEHYNGAFAACPDPVDFHAFTNINLYGDKNAFKLEGPHRSVEQPGMHDYLGRVSATQRDLNYYELALGDHGRSGEQFDIWQAVYSPVGPDGYPAAIFDKKSGAINSDIAAYWRDHYDLSHILERDWKTLGPKLQGKIHIYVGTADTYFLNDAVYYAQDVLEKADNPRYDGEVKYGDRAEHCWNGDPKLPNYLSRLHYNTMYVPQMLERMEKTAPAGADLKSWRY